MNEPRIKPIPMPLNREEAQRYSGVAQALMIRPQDVARMGEDSRYLTMTQPNGVTVPVMAGGQIASLPEIEKGGNDMGGQNPVPGGEFNGGIRPDGMLPPAGGVDPSDGMSMAMPRPAMQSMQPMPQPGAAMDKRGLGRLMAGLAARSRGF